MPRLLFVPALLILYSSLSGQKTLIYESSKSIESIELIEIPKLNNAQLREEAEKQKFGELIFAKKVSKKLNCEEYGTWESIPGDRLIWRLRIKSKGAASLNLAFSKYFLPKKSTLLIYNKDRDHIVGPFTYFDNNSTGTLWSPIIPHDEIILELKIPSPERQNLQLEIGEVNHGFRDHLSKSLSGSCHLDVVCGASDGFAMVENYRDVIRSVGVYSIEGIRQCTGALINNSKNNCKPYFLTANHCGITASNAESVVIHWNYENQSCRMPDSQLSGTTGDGSLMLSNSGTKLISKYNESDFALLELNKDVPAEANAFFAGWNVTGINTDTTVCIHHPVVEEKRISFDFQRMEEFADNPFMWIINNWEIGSTEGGSSGAPIFNTDSEIIGELYGGEASCGNDLWDIAGRLDLSWEGDGRPEGRLKDWLDPSDMGITHLGGRSCSALLSANEPVARVCNFSNSSYSVILSVNDGFAGEAILSFENNHDGIIVSLEKIGISSTTTSIASFSVSSEVAEGDYEIKFSAKENDNEAIAFIIVRVSKELPSDIVPISPSSTSTVGTNLNFLWEDDYEFYDAELSIDPDFRTLFSTDTLLNMNQFSSTGLNQETKYYWRVRGINECGIGPWTNFFFETGKIVCTTYSSNDLPLVIEETPRFSVISRINIPTNNPINDVNIQKVKGSHTFVGDLQFRVISPSGTEVTLLTRECSSDQNFDLGFDDESESIITCPINNGNIYIPFFPLSAFNDEPSQGIWQFQVLDLAELDGGSFEELTIEVCTNISKTISTTEEVIDNIVHTYPNPARDILFIEQNQSLKFPSYSIFNLAGIKIQTGKLSSSIDISQISNGIYFMQIRDDNKLLGIKKLVISKYKM